MSIVGLLIFVVIVGLVLWLIETQLPLPGYVKVVIRVLIVLFIIVWLLSLIGYGTPFSAVHFR